MTIMAVYCLTPPPMPEGRGNFLFSLGKNVLITRVCMLSTFPAEVVPPAESKTTKNVPVG